MPQENLIGEYLRARRELVPPQDIGIPDPGGRRRVPGLRREEVAMLAGVSSDYYVRLQLDGDATAYLHRLAAAPARRRRTSRPEKVPAGILQLIASWTQTPAYVHGRYMDVLAVNPLAAALFPWYVTGENLVRAAFLDPRVLDMYRDWAWVTESTVGELRALVGPDADDPRLNELVGELSVRSERFRRLWARHDVRLKCSGTTRIEHPLVGVLELSYEKFPIPGTSRQTLGVYHTAPGSASAQALALLTITAAEQREPARPGLIPGNTAT